jgi:photosystem II stability/assembly factor-like uncharacterized protein
MIAGRVAVAADPPAERAKVEGFAVVRIVKNGGNSYHRVMVERVDGDRRNAFLSGPVPQGADNPATYAGWLDPGTYSFLRLEASTTDVFVTLSASLDLDVYELPTLTVAAGELVDLGTWLLQPIDGRVALVLLNDAGAFGQGRHNEQLDEAAAAFPGSPTLWDGAERWGGVASPNELVEASKRATVVMKPPQFDNVGNAYFASALGQVLRRTPRGEWRNLDTGTLDTLSSLWVDGSNVYVSTEQHRLVHSSDGGATWTTVEAPVAPNVTAIARLPDGDFVAATEATDENETLLLRGPDFLALPPTPWKTLQAEPKYQWRQAAMVGPVADRLVVWSFDRWLHVYDIGNDRWTSSTAKERLAELYVNGSAGLVYSASPVLRPQIVVNGVRLVDGLISADGGTTWQSLNLGLHNGFGFRDRQNGIAMLADGPFGRATVVATTSDGGKTWNPVETTVPGFCITAQYLPPTDELVCMTEYGNILSTRTGQDWATERAGL